MNLFLLPTFWLFFYVTDSQSRGYLLDDKKSFGDSDGIDELNVITKHCGNEYFYRKLRIISTRKNLSVKFYKNIHEESTIPIEVFNDINDLKSVGWHSCVILFLSTEQINSFSKSVDKYSWKPSNIYVIHVTSEESAIGEANENSLEYIWSLSALKLWQKNSVHKFLLSMNGRNILFDPFEPPEISRNTSTPNSGTIEFQKNSFGALKNLEESAELLKNRDTFEGYVADVALFPYITAKKTNETWSGLDVDSMTEICRQMNVTPRIYEPPEEFGWFKNGKYFGTLGRLLYRQSDLAFNGFFVKDYETNEVEFSSYLLMDKICVLVPKRPRVPEYLLIVRIFSLHTWALILVGNSFVVSTYVGMTSLNFYRALGSPAGAAKTPRGENLKKKSLQGSPPPLEQTRNGSLTRVQRFLATWIFLSFYPIKTNPKHISQRLHLACGLMLGIVMGGCFTSKLASSFSKPAFLKNIDTLDELDESGLEVLTSFPNLLHDVFADDESATFRNLQTKLALKTASEIETQVSESRNASYLDRRHTVILNGKSGNELHVVSDFPKEYHLGYPIVKGSPFTPRMNKIIGRLQSGGMYRKWFNDMKIPSINDESKDPVVIRLPHLYIPFFMLLTGLGISGGVFCYEMRDQSANGTKKRGGKCY